MNPSIQLSVLSLLALVAAIAAVEGARELGEYYAKPPMRKAPMMHKPPGKMEPKPEPVFRLLSITKWNATANITALHETEVRLTLQCKHFLLAGLVGVTPVTPTWLADGEVDILWGNHVKVYDYVSPAQYTNFSACINQLPERLVTRSYETWKNRALYPTPEPIPMASVGAWWTANLINVTDRASVLMGLDQFGMEVAGFTSLYQAAATVDGVVAAQMDIANLLAYKKPQGLVAVSAYGNGVDGSPIGPLDIFMKIGGSFTNLRRIAFQTVKIL
ncbi:hypothetical protein CHLRE_08g359250v5 [Chlamydomonas reinhardtii]|uniref:Uncharacterized protein n=1 Tax=Chlamydomonas reinhardtii TaxID=3055 RepID=A0A2K3DGC0_CHLRE|nr:uncharacterized protein CHLRE_08g359250v5 [Chlamydomonas reinhardtii]PNW79593.1 hypothetical protein CHLRE_08g359250v5 [Chlamydomonas reinhardtii]